MSANLKAGNFNSLNVISSDLNNIKFDWQGNLSSTNKSFHMISKNAIKLDADSTSRFKVSSGDIKLETDAGNIKLESEGTSSEAIFLEATDIAGGIKMSSGTNGIYQSTTGDISLISNGADINIGIPDDDFDTINVNNLTRNIQLEATSAISMNSDDFQVVASDSVSILSLSNEIIIGDSVTSPAIRISNGDISIGGSSSTSDGKFVISVSQSSSRKTGYDGLVVKSNSNDVSPEILIKNNNGTGRLVAGVESSTSVYSIHESYLAYKSGTNIIRLNGPEFSSDDINKTFYWTQEGVSETITGTSTYVGSSSVISNDSLVSTHTLTTGGTYTGTTTKYYYIEIDLTSTTPNKFKWSNDGGNTFEAEYVNITTSAITLESGITITFNKTTGFSLGDYFTFVVGPTLTVATSSTYLSQEAYTTKPNMSYLMTETATDLKLGTANTERLRLTSSGNVGINTQQPLSTFHVSNKVNNKYLVNTTTIGEQIHPSITRLANGGYVIVWESINSAGTNYDIYGQIYYPDGTKNGNEFRVNNTITYNQSNPIVAANVNSSYGGFIVVWASEESTDTGVYNIRAQIYNETNEDGSRALKDFDIEVNQSTSYNQKFPYACSLTSGDYVVVWESDDSNTGNSNIYAQKVTQIGNLSGSETLVNTTVNLSQNYPVCTHLSDDDTTVAGGFVVAYMSEYTDTGAYDIRYRIFNSDMSAYNADDISVTSGTTKTYGRCSLTSITDGGFAITYFNSYNANTSNYENGETVTSSDGTTAVIAGINSSYPTKLHVENLSPGGLFHTEALVTGSNSGHVEQVESVSSTSSIFTLASGDREITFSNNIINLIVHKYVSNSSTPTYTNSSVNTTALVDYNKLVEANPTAYTRDYTIFDYKRPRPSISQLNDDNLILAWNSGNTPTIYYQKINISSGSNVGNEININPTQKGIVEYNPEISSILTHSKLDAGFVITWQSETIDHSSQGITHMKLDDDNYLMRASNGSAEWTITNNAEMGLGVTSPSSQLHIKGTSPYATLNNTNTTKGNGLSDSKIKVLDGNSTQLAEIKACYHNYESPNRYGANMQLWYKFEETSGMTTSDHSPRSNTGILRNFDLKTHRVDGLIRNALRFDGIDSYIDSGDSETITGICETDFTISIWFKFPSTLSAGTYNLINNGTSGNGLYYININSSNKITAYFSSATAVTLSGTSEVNDNEWHNVIMTHDSSNATVYLYVDGTSEDSDTTTAPFVAKTDENVYIGSTGGASNYFTGLIDDVRIYNIYFNSASVTNLYNNVNNIIGRLIFKTNNGSNNFYDEINSLVIDEDSQIRRLHVKGFSSNALSGTIVSSGTTVTGTSTFFSQELMVGDQLDINGTRATVTTIASDTSVTISDSVNASDSTPTRHPAIVCVKDVNDTIQMVMDDQGQVGFGESNPTSLLHLTGTTPYLTLENSTSENTNEGRESRILFKGLNSSTTYTMAQIEVSHDSTSADTKGKMEISVNNGTSLTESVTLNNTGYLYVGPAYSDSNANRAGAQFEVESALNSNCNLVISNNMENSNTSGIGNKRSNLYFHNAEAGADENDLDVSCYAKIMGSADSDNSDIVGRLDLFTNNEDTLTPYISIKNNGKVGIGGLNEPVNNIHLSSVQYAPASGVSASQSGTTVTGTNTSFTSSMIGSVLVYADNNSAVITAVGSTTSITVGTSQTVADQTFKVYYPGASVTSTGKMLVNTTTTHPAYLHVEGNLSSKIQTISASTTTLDETYSVILADTSSNSVELDLPAAANSTGIQYTIKKISASNNLVIDPNGSENIEGGSTSITISTNNVAVTIACNGTAWYIIGHFDGSL